MNNTNTLLRTKPIVVQGIPDRVLQFIKHNQGRHHVNIFWGGGGYVNLGPLTLDNTRTLVNALQKQNS